MANPARAKVQATHEAGALSPELAQRLQVLDAQFRAGLPERLAQASAPAPAAACAALHRLAGAAGLYGRAALAECAREAMEALAANPPQLARHAAAMQSLAAEIDQLLA